MEISSAAGMAADDLAREIETPIEHRDIAMLMRLDGWMVTK
jgi:hypothetical protein